MLRDLLMKNVKCCFFLILLVVHMFQSIKRAATRISCPKKSPKFTYEIVKGNLKKPSWDYDYTAFQNCVQQFMKNLLQKSFKHCDILKSLYRI